MRTTKDWQGQNRVIIKVFVEQKQTHRVKKNDGTYADLFMGFTNSSLNGWNFKPTVGEAISDCDEIKVGDSVFCPYVTFENDALEIMGSDLKRFGYVLSPGEKAFAVSKDQCWMGVRNGEIYCIGANMICKRVYEPEIKSCIEIVSDKKKYENYVYVEQMPPHPEDHELDGINMSEIKAGDVIAVKTLSDIEFKYVWENEHKSLIRVNFVRDFLGFTNNGLSYRF